ncbi:MAG: leucine-rich repeat protein [Lachnospiraceae bacterium]|nr:leucine-rich repeat protein [Lachnospiraceae bacterium]
MKKNRYFKRMVSSALVITMCISTGLGSVTVKADGSDPVTTLQNAFSAFESSEAVYMDYTAVDGDTSVHEQVELDRKNKIKKIISEDSSTGKTTNSYIDLKKKITYTQKSASKWEVAPTAAKDLESVGRILAANGVEPVIVAGVTYVYDGEETVAVTNARTEEDTEVECFRFSADIPIASADDYDDEEDEDAEEYEEGEDVEEEEVEPETANVHFYVEKSTGRWVHADIDTEVSLDIVYPTAVEVALSIPQKAKKSGTLKNGYVMAYKGVKYKVQYKKKKAYLVVSGSASKAKLTVEKTVKILGKKYKVTEIGNNAFAGNKKLKTLVVKADVTKLGKQAFYNSKKLKTITFRSTAIKSVGKNAFKNVPKTATIKVPGKKKADYSKKFKKAGFKGKVK